jgi:hypothetical protein
MYLCAARGASVCFMQTGAVIEKAFELDYERSEATLAKRHTAAVSRRLRVWAVIEKGCQTLCDAGAECRQPVQPL